jgi:sugar O-acyltransferase (sialic acid O-acetyltransferase NeuD family)
MKLGIYGSGGLGREIYEIAIRRNLVSSSWDDIIFIDDINPEGEYFGTKRINFETFKSFKDNYEFVIAVGEPSIREKLFNKLIENDCTLTILIDPTAIISSTAHINKGTIVCEFSTIHTGVVLGQNTLIQPFCDLGHDIKVGNHSVLSTHCAPGGYVIFGERVFIGMQSSILELLTIGNDAIVGMGSVVYRDVLAGTTVLGNPARVTKGSPTGKVFASK